MAIPLIAAFAAGAAGVGALAVAGGVAAGVTLGTVAAYATIAGAVMTGVGALTGSKDLMKIGAVLSIGGGVGSWAAGASAASTAAEAAAADGALAGSGAAEGAIASTEAATAAAAPTAVAPTTGIDATGGLETAVDTAAVAAAPTTAVPTMTPSGLQGIAEGGVRAPTIGAEGVGMPTDPAQIDPSSFGKPVDYSAAPPMDRVAAAAKQTTTGELTSWFDKAKAAGGAVSGFIKDNPQLVKIGGDMLAGMYGPQAQEFDYKKGLMEQARAALNNPVQLKYMKPGGR